MARNDNHISRIVTRFGGQTALAGILGTVQSTISEWVSKGSLPYQRILDIIAAGKRQKPPIWLSPNDFFQNTP